MPQVTGTVSGPKSSIISVITGVARQRSCQARMSEESIPRGRDLPRQEVSPVIVSCRHLNQTRGLMFTAVRETSLVVGPRNTLSEQSSSISALS